MYGLEPTAYNRLGQPIQHEITAPGTGIGAAELTAPEPDGYEQAFVTTERITDTPVGAVTIIRHRNTLETFTADDLTALISRQHPDDLQAVKPDRQIAYLPDRDDVVLRWNSRGAHMQEYAWQTQRLQSAGVPILKHALFVVEADRYNRNRPMIYTAVEHLQDETDLTSRPLADPETAAIHTQLCANLASYLIETPDGGWFIYESTGHAGQYSSSGVLFDYDPYMDRRRDKLSEELGYIGIWNSQLPDSDQKYDTTHRIRAAIGVLRQADSPTVGL